jgi:N6-adenosine-specific RNA methylase IME4
MKYRTIVADPPWPMPQSGKRSGGNLGPAIHCDRTGKWRKPEGTWWGTMHGRSVSIPYETMSLDEIAALSIPAEKDAHLYLWTTNRFLESAYSIVRAWGFRPAQLLVWCKPPQGIGMGGAFTLTTEFIIFCRRGKLPSTRRLDSSWWQWSRVYENGHIAHSAKPDAFLDLVEQVSPGPYLELFARRQRLGWDTWGDEALEHVEMGVA